MQPPMWQFKKWHTVGWFHVCMYYNKYISKRGGRYHWKRKRSTLPLPSFFYKKSKKIKVQSPSRLFSKGLEAILVGVVWYHMIQSRHITGNPLNFFPLCLFTHLPVTVPTLSHIWVLRDLMLLIPPPICAYWHISSNIRFAVLSACASISATVYEK